MRNDRSGDDSPTNPADHPDIGEEEQISSIPLAEERLAVTKKLVRATAATVHVRTHHEDVLVSELLAREHVEIERVPVDLIVAEAPQPRIEGNVTVIPVVEEVLVRQYRITEEIHIRSRIEQKEWSETVALRWQEVEVDGPADREPENDPGHSSPTPTD